MEIEIIKIQNKSYTLGFANYFNKVLSDVKLFHWYVLNYDVHNILGEIYSKLSDLFDDLQEEIIGTYKLENNPPPIFNNTLKDIDEEILNTDESIVEHYKSLVTNVKNVLCSVDFENYVSTSRSGINNVKEEVLSQINKSLYLLNMIKL